MSIAIKKIAVKIKEMAVNEPKQSNGFNIENEERSVSPEKLNERIRVGSAGGFLLVAALIVAAASQ